MELDSDTEAVANEGFKLGCISCKMRGEVPATATVDWYFKASGETEFSHVSDKMYDDITKRQKMERKKQSKDSSASCNVCKMIISSSGGNTSNLLKHLSMQHRLKLQECHVFNTSGTASQPGSTSVTEGKP